MRLRIGFIGLGTMGEPIANNLRRAGHDLTVWNRTPARAEHIVSRGGKRAATPRECASGRDAVFTCVSDERALDAVLDGPDGALAGLREGDVLVDLTTAGVACARAVAARVAERGARFVACPILGSRTAAEQAQVVLVAGGPAAARERLRPALHAISARLFELDDPAQAALMKLCVNAIGGAMMTAFGEALALASAGGVEPSRLVEVLQASAFHSPLYLVKGELVQKQDWAPRFRIALAEKDQRLAQEAAAELGARVPVSEAVRTLMAAATEGGRGDQDVAALAALYLDWMRKR
ncbi:NAD(P)-dependent oxidoreductase [Anaeromyxobacter dehalogenans]|uniref:NAD-binding 6-phosphogluconate dehydrogenase n=1 Tax=Anaeromyxobacter dehalogenans (strain 2CP-C) TaxID=290397 RepID=Q2INI0_ANADE|nr:NAD(P)-dependent oxidoreductase [Anaeromyxobacter dehalogenans]ABC80359.1 NAD-binding 6-phosphogluconate dehydrogenase [Anaeromyxobacter dehalogenans 2CP-C]